MYGIKKKKNDNHQITIFKSKAICIDFVVLINMNAPGCVWMNWEVSS